MKSNENKIESEQGITKKFTSAQNRLVLQAADLSLETIAAMVDKKSIDLEPEFQRRERWKTEKQSALIESFLLNVPVPPVYLAEDDFGTYSVIDGKQRISAIRDFMRNKLTLGWLEKFAEIDGLTFQELPRQLQNALEVRPYLRVVTLLKQSDPALKYEVFTRLNRGGEPLNAQEIRNVAYRGKLNDLIYLLGENDFLRQQLKVSPKSSAYREMADAEFVLRFFTLEQNWRNFTGSLRKSMDEFMEENKSASDHQLSEFEVLFNRSISACEKIWGSAAFKRPVAEAWRHQMLAGMYDAQMIAVADMRANQINTLTEASESILERTRTLFTESAEFEESVRRATNTPSRILYRINTINDLLRSFL